MGVSACGVRPSPTTGEIRAAMTVADAAIKTRVAAWFHTLRDRLTAAFQAIEADGPEDSSAGRFVRQPWTRAGGGGGVTAVLRGRVLEKAGVNVAVVEGEFSDTFRERIPGAADD